MLKLAHSIFFLAAVGFLPDTQVMAQTNDAYYCGALPKFISNIGLKQPIVIDTTIVTKPGVVIRETSGQQRTYQQPAWTVTGHVGPTVRDAQGNVYVIPVPSLALDTNPMERRNTIYKINSVDGSIAVFAQLPLPAEESQANPFGVVGLTLDCDTQSLYVSSVAGSTASRVAGKIYQLDLKSGKVIDKLEGVEALGLAIHKSAMGKRLYYGDTRSSNVFSLPLGADGGFIAAAEPKYEVSLLAVKNGDSTQARKIKFSRLNSNVEQMVIDETEFSYRMSTEAARRYKRYFFQLDTSHSAWKFIGVQAR